MHKFYDNIDSFQKEVVGKQRATIRNRPNKHSWRQWTIGWQNSNQVLDQVKAFCRWRKKYKLCAPSNARVISSVVHIHVTKVHSANNDYIGWKVSQAPVKKGADVVFFFSFQDSLLWCLHLLVLRSAAELPTQTKLNLTVRRPWRILLLDVVC